MNESFSCRPQLSNYTSKVPPFRMTNHIYVVYYYLSLLEYLTANLVRNHITNRSRCGKRWSKLRRRRRPYEKGGAAILGLHTASLRQRPPHWFRPHHFSFSFRPLCAYPSQSTNLSNHSGEVFGIHNTWRLVAGICSSIMYDAIRFLSTLKERRRELCLEQIR